MLLGLQAAAGNAAVTGLIAQHRLRQPIAAPKEIAPDISIDADVHDDPLSDKAGQTPVAPNAVDSAVEPAVANANPGPDDGELARLDAAAEGGAASTSHGSARTNAVVAREAQEECIQLVDPGTT